MEKLRRFLITEKFFIAFAVLAFIIDLVTTPSTFALACGILFLAVIIGVILIVSEDLMPFLASMLITALMATRCYNGYHIFMKAPLIFVTIPVGIFVIGALVYNFVHFRRKVTPGRSLRGILAVAVAVTLGGIGRISAADYFSAAYYVFFLGIGMVVLYFVMKSRFYEREEYNVREKFAAVLCVMGLFAAALTLKSFLMDIGTIIELGGVPDWKFRNNFATFMIIAMPAPLMFVKKRRWMMVLPLLIYVAMVLLGSRGGLFMGAAEYVCCLIFISVADRKYRLVYLSAIVVFAITLAASSGVIFDYFSSRTGGGLIDTGGIIDMETSEGGEDSATADGTAGEGEKKEKGEQRVRLLIRSVEDFLDAPIFGQGLGYKGNYDIYKPKTGAMGWYHMMIPQIIGSMGIIGVLAYGFQLFNRLKLVLKSKRYDAWVLCVCYIGLLMMSQVNPGIFCPLPYELLAVMIFILIEGGSPAPEWVFLEAPDASKPAEVQDA